MMIHCEIQGKLFQIPLVYNLLFKKVQMQTKNLQSIQYIAHEALSANNLPSTIESIVLVTQKMLRK